MAEQRNISTGQPGGLGSTEKNASDIDRSETGTTNNPGVSGAGTQFGAGGSATTSGTNAGSSASDPVERQKQETVETAREVQANAQATAQSARQKGAEMAHEAKETAREMKDRAMHSAAHTAEQAQRQAASFADQQKGRVASEIETFGDAFSRAADELRNHEDERVASYADMAAEQLRSTSEWLRSRELGDLMEDVEHFARRRPEVFFGGMLLAGLGIARFLKASRRTPGRFEGTRQGGRYQDLSVAERRTNPASAGYREPSYTSYANPYTTGRVTEQQTAASSREGMNDPLSYH